jgi:Ca2+-transporting ATPase
MALASLPPSHEVLNDAPRKTSDSIISRSMQRGIVGLGSLFFLVTFVYLYWLEHNADGTGVNSYELTKFFTVFVMIQWWNLFNARTLHSNHSAFHHFLWGKGFVLVLVLILLGQVAIVEWGGTMFRTEHLSLMDWVRIILFTMPVMLLGELHQVYKRIRKK